MSGGAQDTVFEAVIVPHRSLTAAGMRRLAGAICLLSAGVSTFFWWLGAWPVAGFGGGEVGLALLLLRHHARTRNASEVLVLSPAGLRVTRIDMHGVRRERLLSSAWLNVVMEERPGRVPGLFLAAGGVREEVATSLGEAEKRQLAEALRQALYAWRHPRFDNLQLQD